MGDITGFKKYKRATPEYKDPEIRVKDFNEFTKEVPVTHTTEQAARCMDCGIPFCHNGCPLGNVIPDFNHAVFQEDWKKAYDILNSTNNFPEFTGRICPAPCEASCVLGINNDAVAIEYIEKMIIERAYLEGWVVPENSAATSGKKVAVIGSGPAGLACADQLAKAGHEVVVYERNDRIGGLLRYGIPDFKLDKSTIDRRLDIMKRSGVRFITNTNVGQDITVDQLNDAYDAIVLCGGATIARDIPIEGRALNGVHLAMEYLEQNNRKVAGDQLADAITVEGQDVVVLGGGDTGSDCIGTSNRLGAKSVTQIELLGKPPVKRAADNPWPMWPQTLRTSSSHLEGCQREWGVLTKRFLGDEQGNLVGIEIIKVEWAKDEQGKYSMTEQAGSKEVIPCTKAFLAIGFLHGEKKGLIEELAVALDQRGNVQANNYQTTVENVFAAGDIRRGQSLVVWAIAEGRNCAAAVDDYLSGEAVKTTKAGEISYQI